MNIESNVGKILRKRNMTIAVAESCTGGLISSRITDSSGSSEYFLIGVTAYSNKMKERVLGVPSKILQKYGAVSKEAALEMAEGVRRLARTDMGVGVTGIAGPTGGTRIKPVGLVYIAVVSKRERTIKEFRFKGSRQKVKFQAAQAALNLICAHLSR